MSQADGSSQGRGRAALRETLAAMGVTIATDEHLVRLMPQVIQAGIWPDDLGVEDQYRMLVT